MATIVIKEGKFMSVHNNEPLAVHTRNRKPRRAVGRLLAAALLLSGFATVGCDTVQVETFRFFNRFSNTIVSVFTGCDCGCFCQDLGGGADPWVCADDQPPDPSVPPGTTQCMAKCVTLAAERAQLRCDQAEKF